MFCPDTYQETKSNGGESELFKVTQLSSVRAEIQTQTFLMLKYMLTGSYPLVSWDNIGGKVTSGPRLQNMLELSQGLHELTLPDSNPVWEH